MKVEWWPQQFSDIPPAIVFRGKQRKVVVEFGKTRFLPFRCRQVIRSRLVSIWVDGEAWRDQASASTTPEEP